ncbi:MAG: ribosome biogenesis GTPase YlqF [bacterium]
MSTPLVSPEKWIALEKRLKKLNITAKDLEERFISGQGKGGQKQNKTQNTVQLTYLPTGMVITCQAYRERERNRYRAKTQLCERLEQQQSGKQLNKKQEKKKKQKERRQRRQQSKEASNTQKINWFPGHMAKTLTQLKTQLKQVDLVIELRDARIPESSFNQTLAKLYAHKNKVIVLSKKDLADPNRTQKWRQHLKQTQHCPTLCLNLKNNKDIRLLEDYCHKQQQERAKNKIHNIAYTTLHILIVGIPNVGKSQLINQWRKKKIAQVANKPGVTKQIQWIPIGRELLLMDSPGLLWPNLENQDQAIKLALIAAIKEQILSLEQLCDYLIIFLQKHYPNALKTCYQLEKIAENPKEIIAQIAHKRRYYLPNQEINEEKTISQILHDFQDKKMGLISLE